MFPVNFSRVRARRNWARVRAALGRQTMFTRAGERRRQVRNQILTRVRGLARRYRATRGRGYPYFKYGPIFGYKPYQYRKK